MSVQAQRATLANGLTVIIKEMREIPVASLWVWYRVGSRNEVTGITGISHWVEHMQFKGTSKLKKGDIFKTISANGGTLNAFTWIDFTTFFETLPSDRLDLAIEIEADRMTNSLFAAEEVENERTVIISEREGSENSPGFLLSEELTAAAFKVHTYHHETIGWKSDLRYITRDELYNYYRTYYAPNNAIVVVVGDFQADRVLDKIQMTFGAIPRGPSIPPVRAVEPPQDGERRVTVKHPAGTHYFTAAYHAPAAANADAWPMLVLDAVLSGGKSMGVFGSRDTRMGRSSRLYRALVDSGLACSAGSSFTLTKDPYIFAIDASLRAGVKPEELERVAFEQVRTIQREGVGREEFERAKKQIRAQFVYGSETVGDQGYWLGNLATVDSCLPFDRFLEGIEGVKTEDVQRVANTYLTENNRTVGWLVPTEEAESSGMGGALAGDEQRPRYFYLRQESPAGNGEAPPIDLRIERTQLGNGIVVLGHENDANPMVVLRASMAVGSVQETDEMAGLAAMVGTLLTRGTENRTFEQLSEETDSLGMSLTVDTGRWATQVSVRALSEDFGRAAAILAEVLRRPTFPENEFEKLRGQVLTELREQANDTGMVAAKEFFRLTYPSGHPYHRWPVGDEETIGRMTREDVVKFYEANYRPAAMTVSVVGAIKFVDAVQRLQEVFGDWSKPGSRPNIIAPPASGPANPERRELHLPGKTQSDIIIGLPTLSRQDPDFYALSMATLILGQLGLMGRLGEDVRDKQGLAYHVGSELSAGFGSSPWTVSAGVNPANVDRAIESINQEIERWRNDLVSDGEMAHAKSFLTGRMPLALESSGGIARMMIDIELYGLGLDYLRRYPGIIKGLTLEQLRDAARRWVNPEHMVTVVVGP